MRFLNIKRESPAIQLLGSLVHIAVWKSTLVFRAAVSISGISVVSVGVTIGTTITIVIRRPAGSILGVLTVFCSILRCLCI